MEGRTEIPCGEKMALFLRMAGAWEAGAFGFVFAHAMGEGGED